MQTIIIHTIEFSRDPFTLLDAVEHFAAAAGAFGGEAPDHLVEVVKSGFRRDHPAPVEILRIAAEANERTAASATPGFPAPAPLMFHGEWLVGVDDEGHGGRWTAEPRSACPDAAVLTYGSGRSFARLFYTYNETLIEFGVYPERVDGLDEWQSTLGSVAKRLAAFARTLQVDPGPAPVEILPGGTVVDRASGAPVLGPTPRVDLTSRRGAQAGH